MNINAFCNNIFIEFKYYIGEYNNSTNTICHPNNMNSCYICKKKWFKIKSFNKRFDINISMHKHNIICNSCYLKYNLSN